HCQPGLSLPLRKSSKKKSPDSGVGATGGVCTAGEIAGTAACDDAGFLLGSGSNMSNNAAASAASRITAAIVPTIQRPGPLLRTEPSLPAPSLRLPSAGDLEFLTSSSLTKSTSVFTARAVW